MSNKSQGNSAEAFAIYYFTNAGYSVSKPLFENSHYDLIVDDGSLKRVQVKSSTSVNKSGSYAVELRTKGGNKSWNGVVKLISSDMVDIVFIVDGDDNFYIFDAKQLHGKGRVTVNPSNPSFIGKCK